MTPETTSESRAGEGRPPSSKGLRALIANAVQSPRGEEKPSEALLATTQEIARTAERLERQIQKLAELRRQDSSPGIETGMLAFLLEEFGKTTHTLATVLDRHQLSSVTPELANRVQELRAITSRNAEVVKRVEIARRGLVVTIVLAGLVAGMAGGAIVLLLQRLLR